MTYQGYPFRPLIIIIRAKPVLCSTNSVNQNSTDAVYNLRWRLMGQGYCHTDE